MKLSVIMPSYNRLAFLRRTLDSFFHLTGLEDYEVIVVDDVSDYDQRADLIQKEFEKKLNLKIILRTRKISRNAGIPFNQAASQAKGEFLLITGPDFMLMNPLAPLLKRFEKGSKKMVAASTYAVSAETQASIEKMEMIDQKNIKKIKDSIDYLPEGILKEGEEGWYCHPEYRNYGLGTPWLIKRADFERMGGFDQEFYRYFGYEDTDFLRKLELAKIPIEIADEVLFIHQYHYKKDDKEDSTNRNQGYVTNRMIYERKIHIEKQKENSHA